MRKRWRTASVLTCRDGLRPVRATETGGTYLTVSDEDILGAIVELAGIFVEPAASTAYASRSCR